MAGDKETIGICGMGRMGTAMARRLSAYGFPLVVWSRGGVSMELAAETHAEVALNPATLARKADVIITSLIDDAAVEAVLEALLTTSLPGKLVVETSTVSPALLKHYSAGIKAKGGSAIDAPVSGGPELVISGKAGLYIGGADADFARFLPVAETLSDRIHHTGPLGTGAAAKIVNNMVLCGYWEVLREALMTGKRAGLSLDKMLDILMTSPGGAPALKTRAPRIRGEDRSVGFPVRGAVKDATLFASVADSYDVDTPAIDAALANYKACLENGKGDEDLAAMLRTALEKG
ncbi:NAD(P)-dependent oxidoreductase [Martelella soudanensis]|uniref:NAD(P)-dependent oxidoreductase n=1 Tax=unclassified Martelella TaxID=2629616 RepID=UPI0015DF44E0|nr:MULTISPECIES: NAD(P)-dependent oxidoreductase [unclassified Martelella]